MKPVEAADEKYMKLALKEAKKAYSQKEVPVGAVIVRKGEVIGRGYNLKEKKQDPTSHAEMIALRQAANYLQSWRLNECTFYVTLEPCTMCTGALLQARVNRLVFGAFDEKAGVCGSLYNLPEDERFNHHLQVISGVLAAESRELLQNFFADLRSD